MLIGEVARRSGVSTRMLRHYDSLGLVRPTGRTVGGYREYADEDLRRIFHVESLRTLGLSLRQIGRVLDDPAFAPSALIGDLIAATEARLERERELLRRLRAVDDSAPEGWEGVLGIVALLQGLGSPSAARRQQAVLAPQARAPGTVLAEAILAESDPNVAGALRWAAARSEQDVTGSLTAGLASAEVEVRRRAVRALADLPETEDALRAALADPDSAVRSHAALELGRRGETGAIPVLIGLVVEGVNDVEAAEALGTLALEPQAAERITGALAEGLGVPGRDAAARSRLVQALAELPSEVAVPGLRRWADDEDRSVARTAAALADMIEAREERG